MKKAALISVSDRTGLIEFASELQKLDYTILGTKGTKIFLEENGIKAISMNKRDSSYHAFGVIEIYCPANDVVTALHLINNNPTNEK